MSCTCVIGEFQNVPGTDAENEMFEGGGAHSK